MRKITKMFIVLILLILSLLGTLKAIKTISKRKQLRHPQDIFSKNKKYIEAHCGFSEEIFPNTLESFKKAIEYGIDSLETDIWLTNDNILVIVHGSKNGEISKFYDHKGKITELNWEQISTFRTKKGNLSMPRLIDLLKIAKNKIYIDLEIKDPRVNKVFPHVIKLIEKFNFFNQISICSFYYEYYNKIVEYNKKNNKQLVFGFAYLKNQTNLIDFTKKGNTINIYWGDVTKELCDKAHQNGMGVVASFYLNEDENLEDYKSLFEKGVDVINANHPLIAQKYKDRFYK